MTQLGARDLRTALEFTLEARATDDLDAFRRELIPGLRRLVACDTLGFNEIDLDRRTADVVSDAPVFDGLERRFLELAHEHPLVPYQRRGDLRARLISDFLSVRAFHRLELYHDIYRPLGIEDQVAFGLGGDAIVAINLGRHRRTFTERDRLLVELVRPHLALAYARARGHQRMQALMAALVYELDEARVGLIQLDVRGRISYATSATSRLLHSYFGRPQDGQVSLPARLQAWVDDPRETRKLTVSGSRGRLVVREHERPVVDGARTLILEERPAGPPTVEAIRLLGVTDRQAQVLQLLASGKAIRQVASELGISADTVEKHLENSYARLGVNTRGQALARVYEQRSPLQAERRAVLSTPPPVQRRASAAPNEAHDRRARPGRADLRAALGVALAAQATDSVQQLGDELLPALHRLVPCDLIGYNEVELAEGIVRGVVYPQEGAFDGINVRFAAVAHQHPLVNHQLTGDLSTQALSDFLTARQFHRLELYQDFYKLIEAEDQLAFGVPGESMVAFALCRSRPSFTWRDRQLLELVRPHLSLAYQHAREQEVTRAVIEALEGGLETSNRGLILLDSQCRVAGSSAAARELLDSYFGSSAPGGDRLPAELKSLVAAPPPPQGGLPRQLTIDGRRGRLRVREQRGAAQAGFCALVLEEQRPQAPRLDALRRLGLTDRQAQVLRLLACGKSNKQIAAELQIRTATVEKHLEHAYQRLDVETRHEAVARIHRAID
jgi:DNA-binding NarL/FixJ family response regulator